MKLLTTVRKTTLVAITAILLTGVFSAPKPAQAFDWSVITGWIGNDTEEVADDRPARIDTYFAKRNMPLEGYGAKMVEEADKYGLDWRLLPAIAVRESSGGKHMLNNNPFGWGSCKIKFANFDKSIEEVAVNLGGADKDTSKYYKDKTVYQILWAYNGSVMPSYPKEVMNIMKMI